MSAAGGFHLAWRYVAHHRSRTVLLALSLGITLALPLAVRELMTIAQREFRVRAESTPLLLGAKGSELELTLHALYFRQRGVGTLPRIRMDELEATRLVRVIPFYARHRAQEAPVIGTSLDYFAFRGLRLAEGRMFTRLGDCLVGARFARAHGLHAGGSLRTSPEQVFDIAGVYPLKMRVTGILAESHTVDDDAVFTDVKTTWLIDGIAHGHDDVAGMKDPGVILERQDGNVAATNAVRLFTEVTEANMPTFHFHGDPKSFPLTAVIALPNDSKAETLLLGSHQNADAVQLVRPVEQMDALLSSLFQAERLALLMLVVLGTAVLLIAALVFALSFRMRKREFTTLAEIGVDRAALAFVKSCEVLLIFAVSVLVVSGVIWMTQVWGASLVRMLVR